MITVNIAGGVGNQLFQYAAARSLNIKSGSKLFLDIDFFSNIPESETFRKFQINNFNIKYDKIISKKRYKIIRFLYRLILRPFNSDLQIVIFGILLKFKIPIFLTRNFQKEKYFIKIRKVLLEEITSKKTFTDDIKKIADFIDKSISVSLHIRRGDYIRMKDIYGNCSMEYYRESINTIKEKLSNPVFFIFSDDIDWVKENLNISDKNIYVSRPDLEDYEELILMSKCKHNIIANSTFSWWGAWLNKNDDKIVIAPKQWFKNKTSNELDILPKKWIQLQNN